MPEFIKPYLFLSLFLSLFSFYNGQLFNQDILRFAAVGFCAVTAFRHGNFPAALFTVVSDLFLIFTSLYTAGICFFCLVHICYLQGLGEFSFSPITLTIVLGLLIILLFLPLEASGLLYACIFLFHIYSAVKHKEKFQKAQFRLYFSGLILFALCDVTLALNMGYNLIWLFYLPGQILLSFTALSAKRGKTFLNTQPS